MFQAQNIHYDIATKTKALNGAGLGVFHLLEKRLGLADALNDRLHLLKRHVPYFESDHILNLTYNLLAGGQTINDLELLRNNEVYLDILGAQPRRALGSARSQASLSLPRAASEMDGSGGSGSPAPPAVNEAA